MNLQTPEEWRELLGWIDRTLIETDALELEDQRQFSPEQHARGTLCRAGATPEQIEEAQARLGCVFPPSYRAFLEASNGMDAMGFAALPGELWNTERIAWLRDQDAELIEIWTDDGANEAMAPMQNGLAIASNGDACDLFLCFDLPTEDGECECWQVASWTPGERRFTSFAAWMLDKHNAFYSSSG